MTRIDNLEKQLKETKQTFGKAILTLVERVKTLEVALKRKTKRVLLSDSEEEETEAQGRKTNDLDPLVSLVQELVTPSKIVNASGEEQVEDIGPTTLEAAAILTKLKRSSQLTKRERDTRKEGVSKRICWINTGSLDLNTGIDPVTTDSIRVLVPSPDRGRREGKAPTTEERRESCYIAKRTKEQIVQEEQDFKLEAKCYDEGRVYIGKDLTIDKFSKTMVEFATKESLKRFGEELQTKTAKKIKFNDEGYTAKNHLERVLVVAVAIIVPKPVQLNAGRAKINYVRPNINTGRTNVNSVRTRVSMLVFNVNYVRYDSQLPTKTLKQDIVLKDHSKMVLISNAVKEIWDMDVTRPRSFRYEDTYTCPKKFCCLIAKATSAEFPIKWCISEVIGDTSIVVLGNFDGKSDEGFLVDKPNVKGVGYRWMFDIEYLTDSMNYIPVSLENQANPHSGAAVDQGEGSAQPAAPHHIFVDPISSTSQPPIPSSPYSSPPHPSPPLPSPPPFSSPHYSPSRSYEAPLPEGNTLGNAEDSMKLKELMDIVPKLVTRIETLETELQQTKTTYEKAVLTLVKRVNILEKALKRKPLKVVISESEGEEPEDQGRII
ncbi:hypothetical protein Tco_0625887 [Tanacetum coccineum]|uniref:Uncharacterized protein n=1 Tax=Tanacetum coccineum TaxID=301880 RepID=A0ABQ4WI37_9ASTR